MNDSKESPNASEKVQANNAWQQHVLSKPDDVTLGNMILLRDPVKCKLILSKIDAIMSDLGRNAVTIFQ